MARPSIRDAIDTLTPQQVQELLNVGGDWRWSVRTNSSGHGMHAYLASREDDGLEVRLLPTRAPMAPTAYLSRYEQPVTVIGWRPPAYSGQAALVIEDPRSEVIACVYHVSEAAVRIRRADYERRRAAEAARLSDPPGTLNP